MLEELKDVNEYIYEKLDLKKEPEHLKKIRLIGEERGVPIITREVTEYLNFLMISRKPKKVLEIGTAIGYSGLVMLAGCEENTTLTTIEIDEDRYNDAIGNFKENKVEGRVSTILGDANDVLKDLQASGKTYDFIFLDAAKGHYQNFFEYSYQMLEPGGMIFIDNILFRGYPYKEYPKRFKTIVKRLDKFIGDLYRDYPNFVLLPFGDGIGLLTK